MNTLSNAGPCYAQTKQTVAKLRGLGAWTFPTYSSRDFRGITCLANMEIWWVVQGAWLELSCRGLWCLSHLPITAQSSQIHQLYQLRFITLSAYAESSTTTTTTSVCSPWQDFSCCRWVSAKDFLSRLTITYHQHYLYFIHLSVLIYFTC